MLETFVYVTQAGGCCCMPTCSCTPCKCLYGCQQASPALNFGVDSSKLGAAPKSFSVDGLKEMQQEMAKLHTAIAGFPAKLGSELQLAKTAAGTGMGIGALIGLIAGLLMGLYFARR